MTTPAPILDSSQVPADAFVLGKRPLAPGYRRRDTSRFAHDRWDLNPAQHKSHMRSLVLNFMKIPACFRMVTKELFYALLADLPDGEEESHVETIRGHLTSVKTFLTWANRQGIHALRDLSVDDLRDYQRYLLTTTLQPDTRDHRLRSARMFWTFRSKLSADQLTLDPEDVKEWKYVNNQARKSRNENSTERIPEQVMAPLLVWALRWIYDFAEDLLPAYDEWLKLNANTRMNRKRRRASPSKNGPARLQRLLDCYRAEERLLPGADGKVNHGHLARELGCATATLTRGLTAPKLIARAVDDLGIGQGSYLRTPIRAQLDGRPWRGPVEYAEMEDLIRLLQAAAYITTAYLSGMRDSEVKHLRKGCLVRSLRTGGGIHRRKIHSLAFKGEDDIRGVPATWVVTEAVDRAIEVLERLRSDRVRYLFALLPASRAYHKDSHNEAMTNSTTNRNIEFFMQWINDYCEAHGRADGIPLVRKRKATVTTSQFRRTLAWFIARQPGGVIAGAIAYRHAGVQMFEGYAGTSDSGFRAEVEAEEAIMQAEKLGEMVTTSEHRRLTGPAAEEAEARLQEFSRHVVFKGKVITDRRRLQRELDKHHPNVYFGQFVTCIHNRDRAMCRRPDGEDGPSLPDCFPLRCRNVALTRDNRRAVAERLAELDTLLEVPDRWAPFVLPRLEAERAEIADFLDRTS